MNRLNSFLSLSLRVGRLFGIPISLHITILFFLLPAFTGWGRMNLPFALEYSVGIVLSILLHELGHALTAKRYGLSGLSITLHGFGGFASSSGYRSPRQALAITLMGPGVTFAWAGVCFGIAAGLRAAEPGSVAFGFALLFHVLGRVNLLLGFLNLIPILPWDGGQALQAVLAHRMPPVKAMRAAAHLGLVLAAPLLIYGFASSRGFFGLFALVGLVTCYSTLANSGGVRFGEFFADRRHRQEMEAVRKREAARQEEFLGDVNQRERERAEKERLRRLLGE